MYLTETILQRQLPFAQLQYLSLYSLLYIVTAHDLWMYKNCIATTVHIQTTSLIISIHIDGARIDFPPLVPKEAVATLMAQMTAAAASAAASSVGLSPNMMPSTSTTSEIVQQAMWLSRAQKLLEEEHQRNFLFKENSASTDSSELAMALLHQGSFNIFIKQYKIFY